MYGRIKKIHFVGIGGIGMSGIAELLLNMGYTVTGSDIRVSETVERLRCLGATVFIGHREENIGDSDVVVVSSAIGKDNPEVVAAHSRKIPVIPRAEMLSELMRLKYGIAIAGSHGKTTVTSMISTVLGFGGFDPTIVVGGRVRTLGTNAHLGNGSFMVVEADESDGSFLMLSPVIAVVTNIDREHLDYYRGIENLKMAFSEFLNKIPFYGLAVICADCCVSRSLVEGGFKKRYVIDGCSSDCAFIAGDVKSRGVETDFKVFDKGDFLWYVRLGIPGRHTALNALASLAVGMELRMEFESIRGGLEEFRGIERRLQVKGEKRGVLVIDDYGHHPQEIKATLGTLKESFPEKRLVVIFQPHRYTRTHLLFEEFVKVFGDADLVFVLDIYPAGESPIEGVTSERLVQVMKQEGYKQVFYAGSMDEVVYGVVDLIKAGDIVLTLGAGNVWIVGERILKEIP